MNPRIKDWHGKRVWIIGASSGIGAETARALLARGARLALSARNELGLHAVAADHPDALVIPLDITDHGSVIAARDKIMASWSGIDLVLVACRSVRMASRSWFRIHRLAKGAWDRGSDIREYETALRWNSIRTIIRAIRIRSRTAITH